MPDFWTHLIAGEKIAAGIKDKKIKSLLDQNYQLFNYSCQGADFFFYNDLWPWQKAKRGPEKGEKVHSLSGEKLFNEILKNYKKEGLYAQSQLPDSYFWQHNLIYLLGFITHYALDRECHPFIIENGGINEKHKLIEAGIDIYIMEQKWNKSPKAINPLPYYQLQEEHFETLNYFYQLIFKSIFREKLEPQLIRDSYSDLRKYHKFFSTKDSKKYYLFKFLNLILPQNLSQHCYALNEKENIWPKKKYRKFEKSFDQGIESAQKLIEQTLEYFKSETSLTELLTLFSQKNFLGEEQQ